MRAYFTEARDVGDHATLTALAAEAGMYEEHVRELLASDEGAGEVRREIAHGVAQGVSAVPTFVIDGEFAIPGAQDPDVFVRALERMLARRAEAAAVGAEHAVAASAEATR